MLQSIGSRGTRSWHFRSGAGSELLHGTTRAISRASAAPAANWSVVEFDVRAPSLADVRRVPDRAVVFNNGHVGNAGFARNEEFGRVRPIFCADGSATNPPIKKFSPTVAFDAAFEGGQSVGPAFDQRHLSFLIPKYGTHPIRTLPIIAATGAIPEFQSRASDFDFEMFSAKFEAVRSVQLHVGSFECGPEFVISRNPAKTVSSRTGCFPFLLVRRRRGRPSNQGSRLNNYFDAAFGREQSIGTRFRPTAPCHSQTRKKDAFSRNLMIPTDGIARVDQAFFEGQSSFNRIGRLPSG